MNTKALELIETKLAFLERANTELSDVVFGQQRTIDALRGQITALAARMQTLAESDGAARALEDERPPHY